MKTIQVLIEKELNNELTENSLIPVSTKYLSEEEIKGFLWKFEDKKFTITRTEFI